MLSKRSAAIITAYTGFSIGDFGDARDYMEELMEKDPKLNPFAMDDSMKDASRADFLAIKVDDNDPEAMTEREAAIITAFTGIAMGNFGVAQGYFEEVLGHPVWTHELAQKHVWMEIKEKARPDFIALHESIA